MSVRAESIYALLPAVYRIRDAKMADERGGVGPLHALVSAIAEQFAQLDDNIDQLYDDLFIETCAKWVVPYIGDLIGARGIAALPGNRFTERAFVANTMAYRRRKGTAAVLEQLARDVTGWNASAVEFFERLATTRYLNHLRLPGPGARGNVSLSDVRDEVELEAIGTPFDHLTRTADVRHIASRRGLYNIPSVGIFLYRLWDYTVTDAPAFQLDPQRYLFDALGKSIQLFSSPAPEEEIARLAEPINVPLPLTRRALARDLRRVAASLFYGPGKSLFITIDGAGVAREQIDVCDLSDVAGGWAHMPAARIALDPVLGRLVIPTVLSPASSVRVSYAYGFSDDIGGGEYERTASLVVTAPPVKVAAADLQQGLNQIAVQGGAVEITDNAYFAGTLALTSHVRGRDIEVRAAAQRRPTLVLSSDWPIAGDEPFEATLNGLLISGAIRVPRFTPSGGVNRLTVLRLRHCTLVPGSRPAIFSLPAPPAPPTLIVELPDVAIEIEDSIVGAIRATDDARVWIKNSVVDAGGETAPAFADLGGDGAGAPLDIRNTTVIGKVWTQTMTLASSTIFLGALAADDRMDARQCVPSGCRKAARGSRTSRQDRGCRGSITASRHRRPTPHGCGRCSRRRGGATRGTRNSVRTVRPRSRAVAPTAPRWARFTISSSPARSQREDQPRRVPALRARGRDLLRDIARRGANMPGDYSRRILRPPQALCRASSCSRGAYSSTPTGTSSSHAALSDADREHRRHRPDRACRSATADSRWRRGPAAAISPSRRAASYVDGLLCELDAPATYTRQPHLPNPDFTVPASSVRLPARGV